MLNTVDKLDLTVIPYLVSISKEKQFADWNERFGVSKLTNQVRPVQPQRFGSPSNQPFGTTGWQSNTVRSQIQKGDKVNKQTNNNI